MLIATLLVLTTLAAGAFAQQAAALDTHRLSLPGRTWSFDISIPYSPLVTDSLDDGGNRRLLNAGEIRGWNPLAAADWFITMLNLPGKGDAGNLRDSTITPLIKKGVVDKFGVKTSDYKQFVVARYAIDPKHHVDEQMAPRDGGYDFLHVKVLEAYLVKAETGIIISFRVNSFKKNDEAAFYAALDSLKINESPLLSNSFDYYQKGHQLILQGEHRQAIEPLMIAFDLELKKRELSQLACRGLVQSLITAYSTTGERGRLKEILDFGIAADPTYPGFYLLLARVYAARDDLDNTIASLQTAFTYKKNKDSFALSIPDPLADPAFQRFQNNEKFRQSVKAMKK